MVPFPSSSMIVLAPGIPGWGNAKHACIYDTFANRTRHLIDVSAPLRPELRGNDSDYDAETGTVGKS